MLKYINHIFYHEIYQGTPSSIFVMTDDSSMICWCLLLLKYVYTRRGPEGSGRYMCTYKCPVHIENRYATKD